MDMANSQIRNLGGKKKSLITLLKNERKEMYEKKLRNGRLQHTHCSTNSSGLGFGLTNLQNRIDFAQHRIHLALRIQAKKQHSHRIKSFRT